MKNIRVLIVDDSAFMRKLLTEIIDADPECHVIKTARNGIEALKAVQTLRPDVVTMDVELPEIDGLTCVAYIMEKFPTPVVMVTGFSAFLGEETITALEYGAVGLLRKPPGPISGNIREIQHELISQIKIASKANVKKVTLGKKKEATGTGARSIPKSTNKIVVIASSSGGPRALGHVIPRLPADLPAGLLVVQHMPAEIITHFAGRLQGESKLLVKVAEDSEPIQQGKVLIAPTNVHCRIEARGNSGESIKLVPPSRGKNSNFVMANELMTSVAPIYGKNATGVVLTGMGSDGTEGLRAIKKHGGHVIAEDESTCIVNGMPRAAIQAGVVDTVVPLHDIADEIIRAVKG